MSKMLDCKRSAQQSGRMSEQRGAAGVSVDSETEDINLIDKTCCYLQVQSVMQSVLM